MWGRMVGRLGSPLARVITRGASHRAVVLLIEARDVLQELVLLKRMADEIDADPSDPLVYRKKADYVHRKRIAWRRAREWVEWAGRR